MEETTCTTNSFAALPRLQSTAVDCTHEVINGESGIKGEAGKILHKINKRGVVNKAGRLAKNGIVNKRGITCI